MATHRFTREQLLEAPPGDFRYPITVRLQDVDAAGVVFFAHVLAYFNDALLGWFDANGFPVARLMAAGVIAPVKHAEADYLGPLRFGDRVVVELVRAQVEPTQATIGYRLSREGEDEPLAVGQTAHVVVDRTSFLRVPMPDELLAALRAIDG